MRKITYILKHIFPKIVVCIASALFWLLMGSHPARSQPNLRYYLEIDEQTWNAFFVNITVNNNRADKLLCEIPTSYLSSNQPAGSDISNFEVTDRFSTKVAFDQIAANSWLIDAKDNDIINISYRVSGRRDHIMGERLSRNFARVDCGSVFLYVREYRNSPIDLSVRVPHGWKLATGLASTEQMFEYRLTNYAQLLKHPLYMAPFEEIYFRIKDRMCYILIDGRRTAEISKLSSIAAKIAFYQTKLLDDVPFDRYLFIFKPFSGQRPFVSKAYQNTAIFYFSYEATKNCFNDIVLEIASNFFQIWNGNRFYPLALSGDLTAPSPGASNPWFRYGTNYYYAALSLVRAGYWTESDFVNYQVNVINRLLRFNPDSVRAFTTQRSAFSRLDETESLAYTRLRGQLISLLLDLKIRALTNNSRSLDDIVFFMNKWFGAEGAGYHDDDILRAITAVAGVDLTTFFDRYVNRTADLPLIETLQSAGIFLESKIDTVPDLGEFQIATDANVIDQIAKFSPLETAGVKTGDKLVSFHDQPIFYPQQIEPIVDSLKIGQEINLSVQREGIALMLIAKIAGKRCDAVSLLSLEPKTELQHLIRKSWLAKQLP